MSKVKVLVVDDSALIRLLLSDILNSDPDLEVVATAYDAFDAREKIKQHSPDVITLDIEMPKMDGITFLKKLMRLRPIPVVMISSLTEQGAAITLEALKEGAIDFIAKPKVDISYSLNNYADEIIAKVKIAAKANISAIEPLTDSQKTVLPESSSVGIRHRSSKNIELIAIAASTGGTEAIREILRNLPASCPPIVIVQHIPLSFCASFASGVNRESAVTVSVANDGQALLAGHAYIAPGDQHLKVEKRGADYVCRLDDGETVRGHKPSADVLFNSIAENAGENTIGLMLTGMGKDGAQGMLAMKKSGALNFVQDEASSVVWGMPGQAIKVGAAELQVPLDQIAKKLQTLL